MAPPNKSDRERNSGSDRAALYVTVSGSASPLRHGNIFSSRHVVATVST